VATIRARITSILKDPRLLHVLGRLLIPFVKTGGRGSGHLLIAPPGAGNIGDRALVEAFVENVPGTVVLIARNASDFTVPPELRHRVTITTLPSLVYGRFPGNFRDLARLVKLFTTSSSVSVVGADIMDGAYNHRASTNRSNIADLAARSGLDSRILGFSWNGASHPAARKALARAAESGAQLMLRDPISYERAGTDGLTRRVQSADMVFAATTVDSAAPSKLLASFGDPQKTAVLNVSGLIAAKGEFAREYVLIVDHLRSMGYRVVLLPHVLKAGSNDLLASRAVMDQLDDHNGVHLVEDILSPAEIRGLTALADIVVTGRMHLAVMSFYSGRLPITLATQGKVEGLMKLHGTEFLCVSPTENFHHQVVDAIDRVLAFSPEESLAIRARGADVLELARRNFAGLGSDDENNGGSK
jgi:colanic acid/amylovoran biosynthesis protein